MDRPVEKKRCVDTTTVRMLCKPPNKAPEAASKLALIVGGQSVLHGEDEGELIVSVIDK